MKDIFANRKMVWGGAAAIIVMILVLIGVAAACRISAPDATEPTKDPNLVLTEVNQNAETMRVSTAQAAALTATAAALTPATPQISLTPTLNLTSTVTTPAAITPSPGPTSPPGSLRVVFGGDVTVPDGTVFAPNTPFTKTWRLVNGGTVTWTTAFSMVFMSGDQMAAPPSMPMLTDVPPGGSVDVSINMVAPGTAGRYVGNWMMRDPNGVLFGIDPDAKFPIYVDITVSGTAGSTASPTLGTVVPTATGAASATVTPSPSGPGLVSNVSLVVDNPNATTCPHTFNFTASFTLSQASSVTYRMEAASNDPNIPINLPASVTTNLEAGTHTLIYTLDFSSAIEGWVQFHVTSPNDSLSNRVNFKLTCTP